MVSDAQTEGTFSIPLLEQARTALSRLSVLRVVGCLNNDGRNFKDLRGVRRNVKSLNKNKRARTEILLAPAKLPSIASIRRNSLFPRITKTASVSGLNFSYVKAPAFFLISLMFNAKSSVFPFQLRVRRLPEQSTELQNTYPEI
jgi:hypothetical protein